MFFSIQEYTYKIDTSIIIIKYKMDRQNQLEQQRLSSPGDSGRNSSSIRQRSIRYPKKRGEVNRIQIRTPSLYQNQQQEQAKKKIKQICFEKCGFGEEIHNEDEKKIEKVLEKFREFGRNVDRECFNWEQLWNEIKAIRSEKDLILIKKGENCYLYATEDSSQSFFQQNKEFSTIKIKNQEYSIWQGVCQLQDDMRQGLGFVGLSGLSSFKVNAFNQLFEMITKRKYGNQILKITPQIEQINRNYSQLLIKKTFKVGISEIDIDQLEYFKLKEYEEGHSRGSYKPIENIEEWAHFVSKRRNKKRKADRFLLHTACQTCFSPHSEDKNPIIICPQCHLRNHFLCIDLSVVDRCGRCIYSRLSKEVKQMTPLCFLCDQDCLTPIRITYNRFAHGFCLLAHNIWEIKAQKLNMKDLDFQLSKQMLKICDLCKRPSKMTKSCCHCEKNYHPICAYLQGYSLNISLNEQLMIDCSLQSMKQTRRYILNFQQMVFRRLNQLKKRGVNYQN